MILIRKIKLMIKTVQAGAWIIQSASDSLIQEHSKSSFLGFSLSSSVVKIFTIDQKSTNTAGPPKIDQCQHENKKKVVKSWKILPHPIKAYKFNLMLSPVNVCTTSMYKYRPSIIKNFNSFDS